MRARSLASGDGGVGVSVGGTFVGVGVFAGVGVGVTGRGVGACVAVGIGVTVGTVGADVGVGGRTVGVETGVGVEGWLIGPGVRVGVVVEAGTVGAGAGAETGGVADGWCMAVVAGAGLTAAEVNGVGVGKGVSGGAAKGRASSASSWAHAARNAGKAAAVNPKAAALAMNRRRSMPSRGTRSSVGGFSVKDTSLAVFVITA